MAERRGHFMPPGLLESQLATFEPPVEEADVLMIDGMALPVANTERVVTWLNSAPVSDTGFMAD